MLVEFCFAGLVLRVWLLLGELLLGDLLFEDDGLRDEELGLEVDVLKVLVVLLVE